MTAHDAPKSIPVPTGTTEGVARAMYETPFMVRGKPAYRVWEHATPADRELFIAFARHAIYTIETARAAAENP